MKKIFIAIPCMDYIHKNFIQSLINLHIPEGYDKEIVFSESSLVHVSRNRLLYQALEDKDVDYILWFDSDMTFKADILDRLLKSIEGKDFVAGLYFTRRPPFESVIYKKISFSLTDGFKCEKYNDYPKDKLFEIEACGFGGVLMTRKLAEDVANAYENPFLFLNNGLVGEDLSFCIKAKRCGYKMYCDSKIKMGHITHIQIDENCRGR